jgi:hypothetical protein
MVWQLLPLKWLHSQASPTVGAVSMGPGAQGFWGAGPSLLTLVRSQHNS